MSDAVRGEEGAYVPCNDAAASLPADDADGVAIAGRDGGYAVPGDSAAAFPGTSDSAAIVGQGVGFVAKPCCEDPDGCCGDCIDTFTRTVGSGLGVSELVGNPTYYGGSTTSVNGTEAVIPYNNIEALPLPTADTTEVLIKQSIDVGTTLPMGNPNVLLASRFHVFQTDFPTNIGLSGGDLYLELRILTGSPALTLIVASPFGSSANTFVDNILVSTFTIWTRLRWESNSPTASRVRAKAWIDGTSEPAWMLDFAVSFISGGGPVPVTGGEVGFDNSTGATETVWRVDSVCFPAGIGCVSG